ncbi:MAG: hypothetical protein ACLPSW_08230 [Roseiarcus sp.]
MVAEDHPRFLEWNATLEDLKRAHGMYQQAKAQGRPETEIAVLKRGVDRAQAAHNLFADHADEQDYAPRP